MRVGIGYDVHALVPDRKLVLGGVEIAFEKGLAGHSDADVLTHAIMDALLGALALGNIGDFFPDTDPAYKDADSLHLLRDVMTSVRGQGYKPGNIDAVVVAQRPKLAPHIQAIRESLSNVLGVDIRQVSVKATTSEKLGFEGREEGISAQAVVLLLRDSEPR